MSMVTADPDDGDDDSRLDLRWCKEAGPRARASAALFAVWFGAWPMDLAVVVDLDLCLNLSSD
ncbi:GD10409 [Drosophila simulans]|uniref:GD10409 n=1 Tax=Drosophila simulans TaxID=7240 RepID=B4QD91_DROSI|nr:GD10409 [Drosophila simulans]